MLNDTNEKPTISGHVEPVVSAAGQDFEVCRQMGCNLEVWNIGGMMCIAAEDDPIYITKEQAMVFFDLQEKAN